MDEDTRDRRREGALVPAAETTPPGLIREFIAYLRQAGKWWLAPIVFLLVILGVLSLLTSTGVAPFFYTLF